jgi:hypothetical protein
MPNAVSSWRVSFFSTKGSNALQIYNFIVKRQCTEKGKRVIIEPVRNKQNKIYGIRFQYKGQTFKASEIGKEFGLRSLFHHDGQSIDERPTLKLCQSLRCPYPQLPIGNSSIPACRPNGEYSYFLFLPVRIFLSN